MTGERQNEETISRQVNPSSAITAFNVTKRSMGPGNISEIWRALLNGAAACNIEWILSSLETAKERANRREAEKEKEKGHFDALDDGR